MKVGSTWKPNTAVVAGYQFKGAEDHVSDASIASICFSLSS